MSAETDAPHADDQGRRAGARRGRGRDARAHPRRRGRATSQLRIYEPPRFFEAFLRGRAYTEAPDITARICGICPVAYQMSAVRGDRGRLRRRRSPSRSRRCAGCSTAASGSRATRCTSTCCTRPTSSATTSAIDDGPRPPRRSSSAGCSSRRPATQLIDAWSAAARSTRSTCASAASTARRPGASCAARPSSSSARATTALETVALGRPASTSPTSSTTTSSSRCRTPGEYPIERGRHRLERRPRHRRRSEFDDALRRGAGAALERAARPAARARRATWSGPLARFNLQLRPRSRRSRARRPREAGLGAGLPQPVPEHRRPRASRSSTPATRRCGSSPPTSRPTARRRGRAARRRSATARPRRRAACSTTATRSTSDGDDHATPGSCRRPRRTSARSSRTCARSSARDLDLADEALTLRCEQAIRNYDPCISCATHFLKLEVDRA